MQTSVGNREGTEQWVEAAVAAAPGGELWHAEDEQWLWLLQVQMAIKH